MEHKTKFPCVWKVVKNRSLRGHVLMGNKFKCYTINIVCVIVFVMGIDNECLECTKSIILQLSVSDKHCMWLLTVTVTKTE